MSVGSSKAKSLGQPASTLFVIEKNCHHLLVKETIDKVENLYKVRLEFREKDDKGQWVELHGDLIDRKNAKIFCQAVCNPTVMSTFKLLLPLENQCLELIESHTNAVIKQMGTLGQYKVSGSSYSVSSALSILADLKESELFGSTDSVTAYQKGKSTNTEKSSTQFESWVSHSEDNKEADRARDITLHTKRSTNESTTTSADDSAEQQTKLSHHIGQECNKAKYGKSLAGKVLSKNLFTKENLLHNESVTAVGSRSLNKSTIELSHFITSAKNDKGVSFEHDSMHKTEGAMPKERSDTEVSSNLADNSAFNSIEMYTAVTHFEENLQPNHDPVLKSSFSYEPVQSRKRSRASKRLSVSLVSLLNASNSRMDNCLEAPDSVKRAILSCLENEEDKDFDTEDNCVVLIDNDEDEAAPIDVNQIVISDDDDEKDSDVTIISLDDTVVEINDSQSVVEFNVENTQTVISNGKTPFVINVADAVKSVVDPKESIDSNTKMSDIIIDVDVGTNNTDNSEADSKSDTSVHEQRGVIVVSSPDYEVRACSFSQPNSKRKKRNTKTFNELKENLDPYFTSLKSTNGNTTTQNTPVQVNSIPNAQNSQEDVVTVILSDDGKENNCSEADQIPKKTTHLPQNKTNCAKAQPGHTSDQSAVGKKENTVVITAGQSKKRRSSKKETETMDDASDLKKSKLSKIKKKELPARYRSPYHNKAKSKHKEKKKKEEQETLNSERSSENKMKKKKKWERKASVISIHSDDNAVDLPEKVRQVDATQTPESTNMTDRNNNAERIMAPRTPITPYLVGGSHLATRVLRYIVIDGSNVAMSHGNGKVFSCRGIMLAVNYFQRLGHNLITVFLPQWRKCRQENPSVMTEQYMLDKLEREGYLVYTPSRRIGRKLVASYDDRFILELAEREDGVVVSNDNFRDLMTEKWSWRKVIVERLLMYSFVRDHFMLPQDPLGRYGPSLERFLRH